MKIDSSSLKSKKLYLLDMDGTIYLGNTLFRDTNIFLKKIIDKGAKFIFITNNSSNSVSDYIKKLNSLGINFIDESNFFTSTQCAILILKDKFPGSLIYVQGTKSFVSQLKSNGIDVTEEFDLNAKCILVGYDNELDYSKMTKTCKMLTMLNVPYYATNPDWVYPTSWGYIPDCGSMCFSYMKATKREPIYIGKPEKMMIETLVNMYHLNKEDVIVIGDRLYTDIASANNANVDSICVLTGESSLIDIGNAPVNQRPKYVFHNLSEIIV